MALTNEVSGESLINLVNPFSGFYGGSTWAPSAVVGPDNAANARTRETLWKTLAGFLTAGAIAAAIRGYKGLLDKDTHFTTKPMKKYLDTTMSSPIGAKDIAAVTEEGKDKKEELAKSASGLTDFTQFALPAAGVLGGSILGYSALDRLIEKSDAKDYDKQIAQKDQLMKKLVAARALQARGMLSDENYNSLMKEYEAYSKKASLEKKASLDKSAKGWWDETVSISKGTAGLLMLLAMAASAYTTKQYFDRNDPARIKEKAMKEGLEQYSKERMFNKPMYTTDPDKELFEKLNKEKEKEKAPVIPTDAVSLYVTPSPSVSVPL